MLDTKKKEGGTISILGNIGYGIYFIDGKIIITHPNGWSLLKNESTYTNTLKEAFNDATEEDKFIDYKLNTYNPYED